MAKAAVKWYIPRRKKPLGPALCGMVSYINGEQVVAVFNHPEFDNHEQVVFCSDESTGLKAIIAIHSTALGPATGGCRMWDYVADEDALVDVLRLSRGMTYKNAMAGLPLGGGKAVIIGCLLYTSPSPRD